MVRVQQATAATIGTTFYVDGTGTDPSPDSATVTITRANGDIVQATTPATQGPAGSFTYQLTPSHTALLDTLKATWVSSLGTLVTHVEVAGGFLFSVAEAQAYLAANRVTGKTVEQIKEMRVTVESALEDECCVAFVPRHGYQTLPGRRDVHLILARRKLRRVRAVTVDGRVATQGEIDTYLYRGSLVYYRSGWWGENIEVEYEHGYDFPPPRVKEAALLLFKNWIVKGPIDDRATSLSTEGGTFSLSTPGARGVAFGIPEVDAVVERYGPLPVFA